MKMLLNLMNDIGDCHLRANDDHETSKAQTIAENSL